MTAGGPTRTPKWLQKWSQNGVNCGSLFFWSLLGPTWASLAPSWPVLVPILAPSCPLLGPTWGHLEPSWGQLGPLLRLPGPSSCPFCPLPAPPWGQLGPSWACPEPSGSHLGPTCSFPLTCVGPSCLPRAFFVIFSRPAFASPNRCPKPSFLGCWVSQFWVLKEFSLTSTLDI